MCLNEPNFNIEEFDRYLDQIMTPAERKAFEARLESDEHYQEAFFFHRSIVENVRRSPQRKKSIKTASEFRHFLKYQDEERFKAYLENRMSPNERKTFRSDLAENELLTYRFKQYQKNFEPKPIARGWSLLGRASKSWVLRIAAVLCIGVLGLLSMEYLFPDTPLVNYAIDQEIPQSKFATAATKADGKVIPDSIFDLKDIGLNAFDNHQYRVSIEKLEKYSAFFDEANEEVAFLKLYIAWSYLEEEEYHTAIATFKAAVEGLQSPNNVMLKEYVLWHLAVAYVRAEEYEPAKATLNELLKTGRKEELRNKSVKLLNLLP